MENITPEQVSVQDHPAVLKMKSLQAQWERTGIEDPRITAYRGAFSAAKGQGLAEHEATLFAAQSATGVYN